MMPTYDQRPGTKIGDSVTIYPGAVIGRQPLGAGNLVRLPGSGHPPPRIGAHSMIGANTVIYAGTEIGHHVMIGDLCWIREGVNISPWCVIGPHVTIMYNVYMGEGVRVVEQAQLTGNMLIEDNVFIGACVVTCNDKHMGHFGEKLPDWQGPILRKQCAIGSGAILMPGIEIGEGAVVAAGAIVTKDVPAWRLAIGQPARITDLPKDWRRELVRGC